jgi:hypothetical protein
MKEGHPYKGHLIHWRGYEHQHIERSSDWFWALGVIAVSAALIFILFNNFLFALLIVIAAVTLGILATKEPEIVDFVLSEKGLAIDDTFYPYDVIKAFWIEEHGESTTLLIDTLKALRPHLVIPVNDVSADDIRDMLKEFIEEEELSEPLSYRILELLGL